jgi:hypothetical protein
MNSNTGKYLTAGGCLLWLLSVFVIAAIVVVSMMNILPYSIASLVSLFQGCSGLCSCLGFFVAIAGIAVMFLAPKPEVS